jgi:hypothetical protein
MTTVQNYKLRCGTPQPANYGSRYFVLQTFGAESQESTMCEDKEQLLESDDMQGLGGTVYQSANYRGKETQAGIGTINTTVFDAEENKIPVFINEDDVDIAAAMFTP